MSKDQSDPMEPMTVNEAGRIGGLKRKQELGTEGYKELGRKGGGTTKERHGEEHYRTIGKKGGATTLEQKGSKFYSEIGKKGGARLKSLIEKAKAMEETERSGA
jgi:general stress protein YciG